MAGLIQFKRPDGKEAPGYFVESPRGPQAPGIVLVQEWWGLSQHIKSVADRLGAEGYRVLAPDLFRGEITKNAEKAGQLMSKLNFPDATDQDLKGAAVFLKESSSKVAVLGFCMGGALTTAASVRVPEFDAAVCFYGLPPKTLADPAKIRLPIQFHFANTDDWCTPEAVNMFEKELKNSPVKFELYRYDAQHAFFNDSRPEVYDEKSAKLAWERSLQFLKKTFGMTGGS